MMLADDIISNGKCKEEVETKLESWRDALERRRKKVISSKKMYLSMNKKGSGNNVQCQSIEVNKVTEFKYLGSIVQSNGQCGAEQKKRVLA